MFFTSQGLQSDVGRVEKWEYEFAEDEEGMTSSDDSEMPSERDLSPHTK